LPLDISFVNELSFDGETLIIKDKPHSAAVIEISAPSRREIFTDSFVLAAPKRPDQLWSPLDLILNEFHGHLRLGLRPVCKAERSPRTSAEAKNEWSCSFTPP